MKTRIVINLSDIKNLATNNENVQIVIVDYDKKIINEYNATDYNLFQDDEIDQLIEINESVLNTDKKIIT